MKPLFKRGSSLKCRLILMVLLTLGIVVTDSQINIFSHIRTYIDTVISPFYFISNISCEIFNNIKSVLFLHSRLELENKALHQKLLLISNELLLLEQYKYENIHLRELLNLPLRHDEQKLVTQVLFVVNNPYSNQVIIDKGSLHDVYEGQPVISNSGVVGQVISAAKLTSRVLLICDRTHALPVQVLRSNIRVIATGNGCTNGLYLEDLPINTDILVGDMLVTSGLGDRFPEGYPVAVVTAVELDVQRAFLKIKASPVANLNNLRYLLLLWNNNCRHNNKILPEEVSNLANKYLMQRKSDQIATSTRLCRNINN